MAWPEQLPSLLARELAPLYFLGAAEPLIGQECRDSIIRAAQEQGFTERTVYEVTRGFDWNRLGEDSAELSLFATRKIVDLRIPTGKPGADGSKALTKFTESLDPDVLLIVTSGVWDGRTKKSKWAKVLAGAGVLVEIWPMKPERLPAWIEGRMRQAGLEPGEGAVAALANLVEGNLLAAQQEIDKLKLLDSGPAVTAEDIRLAVANSTRFTAFRLVECAFHGRPGESLRVADGLRRNGVAIQVAAASLFNELRNAEQVAAAVAAGQQAGAACRRLGIWEARQQAIQRLNARLAPRQMGDCFRALSLIDRQSKGRAAGDPWQSLDRLLCYLCRPGPELVLT